MAKIFGLSTDRISTAFEAMTDREKKMTIGFVGLLAVILVGGGLFWVFSKTSERRAEIESLQKDLSQIVRLTPKFEVEKAHNESMRKAIESNRTSLISSVQSAAGKLGLTLQALQEVGGENKGPVSKNVKERTREDRVRFSLAKLSIDKLTAFLEQLEGNSSDAVTKVMQMDIKPDFQSPDLINVQMVVSTWKLS